MPTERRRVDRRVWQPKVLRSLGGSRLVRWLARAGLGMRALTYLIIGALAGGIAFGLDGEASQAGAMASIAATAPGRVLLWIATASLVGLALWQFAQIAWVDSRSAFRRVWRRMLAVVKSIIFLVAAALAGAYAGGLAIGRSDVLPTVGALLLETAGGAFVLLVAGAIVFGAGVGAIARGIRLTFFDELRDARMSSRSHWLAAATGRIGYISKGLAFVLVGLLLALAVLLVDPSRVGGLDGALHRLATLPFGRIVLAVIALGLVVNGLYLAVRMVFLPDNADAPLADVG